MQSGLSRLICFHLSAAKQIRRHDTHTSSVSGAKLTGCCPVPVPIIRLYVHGRYCDNIMSLGNHFHSKYDKALILSVFHILFSGVLTELQ